MLSVWARKRMLCIVVSCRHFAVPYWCSFQQDSHNGANGQDFMGDMKGISYLVHPYAGFIRIPHVCFIISLCSTMFHLLSEMWSTVSRANWWKLQQEPLVQGAWSQPPQFWGWCLSDALNNAFECRTFALLDTTIFDNHICRCPITSHHVPWCPMMFYDVPLKVEEIHRQTTTTVIRPAGMMSFVGCRMALRLLTKPGSGRRCDSVQSAFSHSNMFGQCLGTVEVHFFVHTFHSHA